MSDQVPSDGLRTHHSAPRRRDARGNLDTSKCENCRMDKKKCQPRNREWPRKCDRCKAKGFECSPNAKATRTPRHLFHSRSPQPNPSTKAPETQPSTMPHHVESVEDTARYVGQNSIPALLRNQPSPSESAEGIQQDMRSILGLDNSAPYPLMSSRHLDRLTSEISAELPSDREVMKLFRTYKDVPHQFWELVLDIDDTESKLMTYLEGRAKSARTVEKVSKPVSASWLAIFFAILAIGSQYQDAPYHTRTRDSQKYITIAFHFLQLGNFLLRPNFDSIQALLMISFSLLNDMKAEGSWALLGLTCRLAQSLGLNRSLPQSGEENKEMLRRRLWWCCKWHDTLTSLSFDRYTVTNIRSCPIPLSTTAESRGWSYVEAMYHLCQIVSERLDPDTVASADYTEILHNCQDIEAIREKTMPHLRNKESCRSAVDRLQYYALRLDTSFVISVCCRPALQMKDNSHLDPSQRLSLSGKCKETLTETVRMFLAMHQLSVIPTRSWGFIYHGLSSAILLGLLPDTKEDAEVRQLQGDLISALSATAENQETSSDRDRNKDIELSGPLSRALAALTNIYYSGSVVGTKTQAKAGIDSTNSIRLDSNSVALDTNTPSGRKSSNSVVAQQKSSLYQDAELETTKPDNRDVLNFSLFNTFDNTPILNWNNIPPMNLYDSIFWARYDPWNFDNDSLNFEFLAPPPPG